MKMSGNTILVTGGGSGIGEALAEAFAARGNTVIVAGRTLGKLEKTAAGGEAIHAVQLDVADQASVNACADELRERFPALNMLIHSAGIMNRHDAGDLEAAEKVIGINLMGAFRIVETLLPQLSANPDPVICTVSSGLGFVPHPTAAAYSATKAGVHSYSQHLRHRLRGRVQVVEIAPPGVQTHLTPGQKENDNYMPLEAFISETMANFEKDPDLAENLVGMVKPFRNAECDGRVAEFMAMLDPDAD